MMIHEAISGYITAHLSIITKFLYVFLAFKVCTENKDYCVTYIYRLTIYLMHSHVLRSSEIIKSVK